MNEILKLAKEYDGVEIDGKITFYDIELEAFYRDAFNAGIEAAAKECEDYEPDDCSVAGRFVLSAAIRALEMK